MNTLYIGIKGHIVCLDKNTGKEIWSTKLKGMQLTNLIHEGNFIFAYTGGHLYCLSADFGKILWTNTLTGYGYGACIFANADIQQQTSVLEATRAQLAANANTANH